MPVWGWGFVAVAALGFGFWVQVCAAVRAAAADDLREQRIRDQMEHERGQPAAPREHAPEPQGAAGAGDEQPHAAPSI